MKDNISGVYGIYNVVSKKWYVGSSVKCVKARLAAHRSMLIKGSHHSRHLQNAWDKYGELNFKMRIVEKCTPVECVNREQYWIDKRRSSDQRHGYNIHPNARNPLGVKRSEETKKKLSVIARSRSPELLARIKSATTTPEVLAKISKAHKGKVLSKETRKRISESVLRAVLFYRDKLSEARKGTKLSEKHKQIISRTHTGRVFKQSQRDAIRRYASNRNPEHQRKIVESICKTNRMKNDWKILNTVLELAFIPNE